MSYPVHPKIKAFLGLCDFFAEAAVVGARQARAALHRPQTGAFRTRRPGADTPVWNVFARELQAALKPYGAKVRLARYLGVPKQRVTDFLKGRRRLPDAELTLRLVHWLAETREGRDPSL